MLGCNEIAIEYIVNAIKHLMIDNKFNVVFLDTDNEFFKQTENNFIKVVDGRLQYYSVYVNKFFEITDDGENFGEIKWYISILDGVNAYIQKQLNLRRDMAQYYSTFNRKFNHYPNAVNVYIRWNNWKKLSDDRKLVNVPYKITLGDKHNEKEFAHCDNLNELLALIKPNESGFIIEGFEEFVFEGEKHSIEE